MRREWPSAFGSLYIHFIPNQMATWSTLQVLYYIDLKRSIVHLFGQAWLRSLSMQCMMQRSWRKMWADAGILALSLAPFLLEILCNYMPLLFIVLMWFLLNACCSTRILIVFLYIVWIGLCANSGLGFFHEFHPCCFCVWCFLTMRCAWRICSIQDPRSYLL